MNKKIIKITNLNKEISIEVDEEENSRQTLAQIFLKNEIYISNVCYGNGTCGKCKIKLPFKKLVITDGERAMLTSKEIEQGICLACKTKLSDLYIENQESEIRVELIGHLEEHIQVEKRTLGLKNINYKKELQDNQREYYVAIDIGTTTIAMAMVDKNSGKIVDTYATLNHQRSYGADVVSRILASNQGKSHELKVILEEDLGKGLEQFFEVSEKISDIIVSGNTTMIYLFLGYSCEKLGKYPFEADEVKPVPRVLSKCMPNFLKEKKDISEKLAGVLVTIVPWISAFVGGDIVAGVFGSRGFETEDISLFIDLGTNGEIALGNREKIVVTSTAAGPAFEAGKIVCGTASVPGSICNVKIQNQRAVVGTIKNQYPPIGICGSGLVSAIAELRRKHLLNEQGLLEEPYLKTGYPLYVFENGERISLYQKDIREFQMAKSAIRAGIEILMQELGIAEDRIHTVYIAGGFGGAIDLEDYIITQIVPAEFRSKIQILGNSSLAGATLLGQEKSGLNIMKKICERSTQIGLAESRLFQEKYLKYLNF